MLDFPDAVVQPEVGGDRDELESFLEGAGHHLRVAFGAVDLGQLAPDGVVLRELL